MVPVNATNAVRCNNGNNRRLGVTAITGDDEFVFVDGWNARRPWVLNSLKEFLAKKNDWNFLLFYFSVLYLWMFWNNVPSYYIFVFFGPCTIKFLCVTLQWLKKSSSKCRSINKFTFVYHLIYIVHCFHLTLNTMKRLNCQKIKTKKTKRKITNDEMCIRIDSRYELNSNSIVADIRKIEWCSTQIDNIIQNFIYSQNIKKIWLFT